MHGTELWIDDGKHQKLVADLYKGSLSSSPDGLALVNGRLVFTATSPDVGRELRVIDLAPRFFQLARPEPLRIERIEVGTAMTYDLATDVLNLEGNTSTVTALK